MVKSFISEQWKEVKFNFEFTNDYRLEVSNFGRLRSYNKNSNGDIITGTHINGYRIIRLKFSQQRDDKMQVKITSLQKQLLLIIRELNALKKQNTPKKTIAEKEDALKQARRQLDKVFKQDTKLRIINYHSLIHRLVAEYFLPKPPADKTVVAHIDFNKTNNRVGNLSWMSKEENFAHQQKSPLVIKEKQDRRTGVKLAVTSSKLTVTKVMLLKKLLNENKPVKKLIKQFKVSDMQIYRIKRGENWKHVPAAV